MKDQIVEFEVRLINVDGDVLDTYHYQKQDEARKVMDRVDLVGDVVAVALEKHTTIFSPREDIYKTLNTYGNSIALKEGGWI